MRRNPWVLAGLVAGFMTVGHGIAGAGERADEANGLRDEVAARARELRIAVPADRLAALLAQAARHEAELESCRQMDPSGAACRPLEVARNRVDARFRELTGRSIDQFRDGGPVPAAASPGTLDFLAPALGETCFCSFTVYSSDRWMAGSWGLECNNHGGHGVCSTNVDSLHSPGIGAMTGRVTL